MAGYTKDEIFSLIIKNTDEYAEYKKSASELDLSELDFSGKTLNEIDFSDADLTSANFSECQMTECKFTNTDLTSADFARANLVECDFSESLLNGTDFSYATVSFCNFTDADMAGAVFNESDLKDSDFAASENMNAIRFDEATVFPEIDMLPDDFDSTYTRDLSSLEDEDEGDSGEY